ncbi:hypothetical protein EX30DRAFT_395799, partial [Ascodesmis nigricans]
QLKVPVQCQLQLQLQLQRPHLPHSPRYHEPFFSKLHFPRIIVLKNHYYRHNNHASLQPSHPPPSPPHPRHRRHPHRSCTHLPRLQLPLHPHSRLHSDLLLRGLLGVGRRGTGGLRQRLEIAASEGVCAEWE